MAEKKDNVELYQRKYRVKRMKEFLDRNCEKIMDSVKGKITFDYKGTSITARHEEVYEKI